MPIERRIGEGAERNAGVLDPDVDRFLDSVVHKTRRRQVVRRSFECRRVRGRGRAGGGVGPSVLDGIEGANGMPGASPTPSVAPSVPPVVPVADRHVHPVDPRGDRRGAGQRHRRHVDDQRRRGWAGPAAGPRWRSRARMRPRRSRCRRTPSGPTRSAPTSARGCRPGHTRWSAQGGFLLLSAISDPCDARVFILGAKPWSPRLVSAGRRSIGYSSRSMSTARRQLGAVDGWK